MKMILPVFFILCILKSHSSASIVSDFCVADFSVPNGAEGYACKDTKRVTADDFAYSGLAVSSNTSNFYKSGANTAFTTQFPALNGLGVSFVRGEIEVGGISPLHTHRVSEVLLVDQGTLLAGFVDTDSKAYYKTLNTGDLFIVPQSLLHFALNVGSTQVRTYSTYASENPGIQFVDNAFFGSNLPTEMVEKVALANKEQVQKIKKFFGGTN